MFDRLSRSWRLVKASAVVLSQDRELLVFPLISSITVLVVLAAFALPMIGLGAFDGLAASGGSGRAPVALYAGAFLFYLVQYIVVFYFNTALVGAAMIRLEGGDPTLGDGLRTASGRIGAIVGYACIAATVGVVLRAIQERVGFIGRIVVGLLGAGWSLATFLVVPVLVSREIGPVEAIRESASLFKRTWGENVIGQAGLGLVFALILFGVVGVGVLLVVAAALAGSLPLVLTAVAVGVVLVIATALVQAALSGIYAAALYRYAIGGEGSTGFDGDALRLAFAPADRSP